MKLKDMFLTQDTGDMQVMVATDSHVFSGMVQSNKTAAFIVDQLKRDTTKEEVLKAMEARFDGSRELMAADIDRVLDTLRSIGALEE